MSLVPEAEEDGRPKTAKTLEPLFMPTPPSAEQNCSRPLYTYFVSYVATNGPSTVLHTSQRRL
jgi:hypothetical protein